MLPYMYDAPCVVTVTHNLVKYPIDLYGIIHVLQFDHCLLSSHGTLLLFICGMQLYE